VKVWKYELQIFDNVQTISMPKFSQIVNVGMQKRKLCMWVEVDEREDMEERYFRVFGTGHPIDISVKDYIGTGMDDGLTLVWHIYEVFG